jgi:hypothetical protein
MHMSWQAECLCLPEETLAEKEQVACIKLAKQMEGGDQSKGLARTAEPVDSALALVAQQLQALKEPLPEVLEEWPVDGLQCVPGRSIH